jgi:hypothetical protein
MILLTMNPGTSFSHITTCFPRALQNAVALWTDSSLVLAPLTISTRGMRAGGLKKWIPTTSSGLLVAAAISEIGMLLVFVASSEPSVRASRRAKRSLFSSRLSGAASMTRSQRAASPSSVVQSMPDAASSAFPAVMTPFSASLARLHLTFSIPESRKRGSTS